MAITPPTQRMQQPVRQQQSTGVNPLIPRAAQALSNQQGGLNSIPPMPMKQTTGIPMAMPKQNMSIKQNLNEMLTATLPATVENIQKNRDNDSLASVVLKGLLEKVTGETENKSNPALKDL